MNISRITVKNEEILVWNIDRKIGSSFVSRGLDVMLAQFLLFYWINNPVTKIIDTGKKDGKWGEKSKTCLREFQKSNNAKIDNVVDPFPPGCIHGKIHGRMYDFIAFQSYYVGTKRGLKSLASVSNDEIMATLLGIPEDEQDLPKDLKERMITVRDTYLQNHIL